MGKAMPSDGRVNQAVNQMCDRGMDQYKKNQVDQILKDESMLKQCTHETLCRAFYEYSKAFKEKNWHIQKHIEIKAWQSSTFRTFMGGQKKGAPPPNDDEDSDPLTKLIDMKNESGGSISSG